MTIGLNLSSAAMQSDGPVPPSPSRQSHAGDPNAMRLVSGSRVAVLGSGPAGSFFASFLFDAAQRSGLDLEVDVYEWRDFTCPGPKGCNMCGGIVSESLVQFLATEGIRLPTGVVQRGIDTYTLHTDAGSVNIETPLHEKRIGAVHRGPGPRGSTGKTWKSFDGYLQRLAQDKGARIVNARVDGIEWPDGRPQLHTNEGNAEVYDLLAVAAGVNAQTLKLFEGSGLSYRPPEATKTHIREYKMPREVIDSVLGDSMHVFLLNIPRLEFAAIIPKGDYVTMCLLGDEIDNELIDAFINSPEVKNCMPESWQPDDLACKCSPKINVRGAMDPYADRLVFIGDSGVARLYKDGIGSAYRTAKAAAKAAVLHGVSAESFAEHFWPACSEIERDNRIGKGIFAMAGLAQKSRFAREVIVRMAAAEQSADPRSRRMSLVLWDMFTGSAPYRDILRHAFHPRFVFGLMRAGAASLWPSRKALAAAGSPAPAKRAGALGKLYEPGEVIVSQGDVGSCMYEIQEGHVEVIRELDGKPLRLATMGAGEFFGEMALFEQIARTATVRAVGPARVMTIDKATLLARVQEDPALALRMLEHLCQRLRTERTQAPEELAPESRSDLARVAALSERIVKVGEHDDPKHE